MSRKLSLSYPYLYRTIIINVFLDELRRVGNLGIKLEIKFRKQELENLQFSQRQEDSKDVIDAYVEATSFCLIHIEPTIFIIRYITSSNFVSTS